VNSSNGVNLYRFAWLSIGAAIATFALKLGAYWLTNSVGLLSDALDSIVNLVAAVVALIALRIAAKPADEDFSFGYSKVEFFSNGFEGGMILIAAFTIGFTAFPRLLQPQPLDQIGLGLLISTVSGAINLAVSLILSRTGKKHDSLTLRADARHLMTDVVTTGAVIVGVGLVRLTGLMVLDPVIALLVAVNVLFTGLRMLRQSYRGLMDMSLPDEEVAKIENTLKAFESQGVRFHALRTRSAAAQKFVSIHILVPGNWSVHHGHAVSEQIESKIREGFPKIAILTHVEPIEDPSSWEDTELENE
jgi:cation diffusion facilitator family transporter